MTAATPNEPEVEAALGEPIGNDAKKLEWAGRTLLRKLKHDALLITRGKDGMALFERARKPPIFRSTVRMKSPTSPAPVIPSLPTFTLALAAGGNYYEAAQLANYAGGLSS